MDINLQYQQILEAIHTALAETSDAAQIQSLLAERDAARTAYTKAVLTAIDSADPGMHAMTEQLSAATKELSDSIAENANLDAYLGKIQSAVAFLAKVAAYLG